MVLLCTECNRANPHSKSVNEFWEWIKSKRRLNPGGLYNMSAGMEICRKFKETYSQDLVEEMIELFQGDLIKCKEEIDKFMIENINNYYINNTSTTLVFYRDFLNHTKNKNT